MKIKIEIEIDTKTDHDELEEIIASLVKLKEKIECLEDDD